MKDKNRETITWAKNAVKGLVTINWTFPGNKSFWIFLKKKVEKESKEGKGRGIFLPKN